MLRGCPTLSHTNILLVPQLVCWDLVTLQASGDFQDFQDSKLSNVQLLKLRWKRHFLIFQKMEEKLIIAVGNHPVIYDLTYRDINRRSQAWREVAETVVCFRLFGEFISSLFQTFLLRMSGAGDSCDWLLVPCSQKKPTSKIFLTLLCGRSVRVREV